jgi:peptide/nickel transport system ATP-binding protein
VTAAAPGADAAVVSLRGLRVAYGATAVLRDVDLDAHPARVHVVLGHSGGGKTTLLHALIGMVPRPGEVRADRFVLRTAAGEVDLAAAGPRTWRALRGRQIGLVAQDPAQSLTPLRRVASLAGEVDRLAAAGGRRRERVAAVLRRAGFADPAAVAGRYCFQLSGGMAQRLGLALALAPAPRLLLADEPSTALDGLARARLAATLREVAAAGAAVLLVTHDVSLAGLLADDVSVLHDGRVVEVGPAADLLARPRHPVSRALTRPPAGPAGPPAAVRATGGVPALALRGLRKAYRGVPAVLDGVDLDVGAEEVVGLAGRSGAGKTTLLRCVVGLERPDGGALRVGGRTPAQAGWRALRREVQLVPQEPRGSLNPWRTAREQVVDPLEVHRVGTAHTRRARADELLERVGLAGLGDRRPGQLSTGQCQRVAIARALAVRPRLLVADEPVTALDAPLRADVLALLRDLVAEYRMAALVVSHELAVLERLCHRIAVLDAGRVVEDLPAHRLRADAAHPLTRALVDCQPVDAVPVPEPGGVEHEH